MQDSTKPPTAVLDHKQDLVPAEVGAACSVCGWVPLGVTCLGCREHYCGIHDPHASEPR